VLRASGPARLRLSFDTRLMGPIAIVAVFYGTLAVLVSITALSQRKKVRIIAGVGCLAWSALMFMAADAVERFNHNAWYSGDAYRILDAYVGGIESGHQDAVLREMKRMTNELEVTYEHRGNFRELAQRAAASLNNTNIEPDGAASRSQPVRSETNRAPAAAGSGR